MNLKKIASMFNNAMSEAWNFKRLAFMFFSLLLSGIVFLFFSLLAGEVSLWLRWPLLLIPIFFGIGFIFAAGTFLGRSYYLHRQQEEAERTFTEAAEMALKAFFFCVPLLLAFIFLWVLLGIFMLLKAIPFFGMLLGIVLSFAPFIINFLILLLFVSSLFIAFYVTPRISLKKRYSFQRLQEEFQRDIFTNLLLLFVAFLPIWIIWKLSFGALFATLQIYSLGENGLAKILQTFFILIPLSAVLAPFFSYFFNFAMEVFIESSNES